MNIVLTKSTMPIIGWIADILGYIINGIYWCLEEIGIPNIGIAIILYTIIMYIVLTPLQIKQQKFSKMNSIMMPEIKKVQAKYKGKKDQESMRRMQEETNAVYQKYGVSPTGSCGQLLIQLPVMLALYQVIYHIPGYISSVNAMFTGVVHNITSISGYETILKKFVDANKVANISSVKGSEHVTDLLYKLSTNQWAEFKRISEFSGFSDAITTTQKSIQDVSMFLGLNISDTPFAIVKDNLKGGSIFIIILAVLIPVLAWFTQWINYKLMPQMQGQGDGNSAMDASMKSMNTLMPLMSAFFCITFPVGIGLYWIAGAVIRSFQQIFINHHMDKIDMEELIRKNQEKAAKKREKSGKRPANIKEQAVKSTKRVDSKKGAASEADKDNAVNKAKKYYESGNAKEGSIASKAHMVQAFDEKNRKK